MRPEARGTIGRAPEGEARLDGDGVGLRPVGSETAWADDVVVRQRARERLVAQRLEVAGGREVPRAAVAPGERPVGDLADKRLHEPVLAALGRPRVDLEVEQLAACQPAQPPLDVRGVTVR